MAPKQQREHTDNVERLNEVEWRRHVVKSFADVNAKLAEGASVFLDIKQSIDRVEKNTSLARNVQVFSDATSLVYRTLVKCAMPVLKTVAFLMAGVLFLYMVTHGGAVPLWSKPWLTFMERLL